MNGGGEGSSGPRMPLGTASLNLHLPYSNGTMDRHVNKPSLEPVQPSAPAPKPYNPKKRYLAEQHNHNHHVPNSATPTPTPSATPTPPVSPVGADTARACEALLALSGGGGNSSGGSGTRSPASGTRSPPSLEESSDNGIDSKIALRKAVWKSVVETASKQKEKVSDKSGEGTKKGTIRGQQIIDHIIENLIVKPTNCDSDATNGLNNNADNDLAGTDSDRIKASIYESLKNDLLKEKTHHARPGDLPFKSLRVDRTRLKRPPVCEEATRLPNPVVTEVSAVRVPTVEPSSSADIMRLVSQNLAAPVSLGQSSVTITRTPRTQAPAATHYNMSSFKEHSQTSLTLTPATAPPTLIVTGGAQPRGIILPHHPALKTYNSQQQFSQHVSTAAVILASQAAPTMVMTSHAPPPGHLVVATSSRPTDCGAVNLSMSRGDDDGSKGRSCKGKRYQEFIEDGRIAVGGVRKRRSHRSGAEGDSEEETALNLSQDPTEASWKKTRQDESIVDWRGGRKVAVAAKLSPPNPSSEANDKAFSASPVVDGSYGGPVRGRRRLPAHTANS